ncbi:MAG TPA: DUF6252 family protein [Chitinophagaceae bacterium]|jgi:hypothetical protein|nr:DUF6252 family protein [Chitinophagaceae bacterium]
MKNILAHRALWAACLVLFLFASCKKDIEELPPATQTGAHTFGAKVDGNLWIPQGFGVFPANDILEARFTGPTSIMINARNFAKSPTETEFEIYIVNVTGPGTYVFNTDVVRASATTNYAYYVKRELAPQNEWQTSSTHTGSVTITKLDVVNNIISGTFQFNALNLYNSPQPISVTEGRFDIKL